MGDLFARYLITTPLPNDRPSSGLLYMHEVTFDYLKVGMSVSDLFLYLSGPTPLAAIFLLAFGALALALGGHSLIPATTNLGHHFKISPMVIAIIVVAGGTSAPELIVSVQAALAGKSDIALGNVLGSNVANSLLVLGIGALVAPFHMIAPNSIRNGQIMLGFTTLTTASLLIFHAITTITAISLLIASFAYLFYVMRKGEVESEDTPPIGFARSIIMITLSIAALLIGSDFMVQGGVILARNAGMSEAAIGLSIIAIGTSLPEIVAVIASILQKRADVALGNIIGSNIFNLGIILGIAGLIAPLPAGPDFSVITLLAFVLVAVVFSSLLITKIYLNRLIAVVFIGFYFLFLSQQF